MCTGHTGDSKIFNLSSGGPLIENHMTTMHCALATIFVSGRHCWTYVEKFCDEIFQLFLSFYHYFTTIMPRSKHSESRSRSKSTSPRRKSKKDKSYRRKSRSKSRSPVKRRSPSPSSYRRKRSKRSRSRSPSVDRFGRTVKKVDKRRDESNRQEEMEKQRKL